MGLDPKAAWPFSEVYTRSDQMKATSLHLQEKLTSTGPEALLSLTQAVLIWRKQMLSKDYRLWSESFQGRWVKRKSLMWSAVWWLQECHWEQRGGQKLPAESHG